jgi:hypothetical protein
MTGAQESCARYDSQRAERRMDQRMSQALPPSLLKTFSNSRACFPIIGGLFAFIMTIAMDILSHASG